MADENRLGFALLASGTFLSLSAVARAIGSIYSMKSELQFLQKAEMFRRGEAELKTTVGPKEDEKLVEENKKESKAELKRLQTTWYEGLWECTFGFLLVLLYSLFEYSITAQIAGFMIGLSILVFVILLALFYRRNKGKLEMYEIFDRDELIVIKKMMSGLTIPGLSIFSAQPNIQVIIIHNNAERCIYHDLKGRSLGRR